MCNSKSLLNGVGMGKNNQLKSSVVQMSMSSCKMPALPRGVRNVRFDLKRLSHDFLTTSTLSLQVLCVCLCLVFCCVCAHSAYYLGQMDWDMVAAFSNPLSGDRCSSKKASQSRIEHHTAYVSPWGA